jgi:hypothetical protein
MPAPDDAPQPTGSLLPLFFGAQGLRTHHHQGRVRDRYQAYHVRQRERSARICSHAHSSPAEVPMVLETGPLGPDLLLLCHSQMQRSRRRSHSTGTPARLAAPHTVLRPLVGQGDLPVRKSYPCGVGTRQKDLDLAVLCPAVLPRCPSLRENARLIRLSRVLSPFLCWFLFCLLSVWNRSSLRLRDIIENALSLPAPRPVVRSDPGPLRRAREESGLAVARGGYLPELTTHLRPVRIWWHHLGCGLASQAQKSL